LGSGNSVPIYVALTFAISSGGLLAIGGLGGWLHYESILQKL
jgi:hypothetical protein